MIYNTKKYSFKSSSVSKTRNSTINSILLLLTSGMLLFIGFIFLSAHLKSLSPENNESFDNNRTVEINNVPNIATNEYECDKLIDKKMSIISGYTQKFIGMMLGYEQVIKQYNQGDLVNKIANKLISDIGSETVLFDAEYEKTTIDIKYGYNLLGNGSMNAPNYCTESQKELIKKYDNMYMNFVLCLTDFESYEEYLNNTVSCSNNLSKSYVENLVNN